MMHGLWSLNRSGLVAPTMPQDITQFMVRRHCTLITSAPNWVLVTHRQYGHEQDTWASCAEPNSPTQVEVKRSYNLIVTTTNSYTEPHVIMFRNNIHISGFSTNTSFNAYTISAWFWHGFVMVHKFPGSCSMTVYQSYMFDWLYLTCAVFKKKLFCC